MSEPSKKHYVSAHVWATIIEVKKKTTQAGKSYLSLMLSCANELYGKVIIFGSIWGDEKTDAFLSEYEEGKGSIYKFTGYFSQELTDKKLFNNFSFYKWKLSPDSEVRVCFIISGNVIGCDEDKIALEVNQEKNGSMISSTYHLSVFEQKDLAGLSPGDFVFTKGFLRAKEGEDIYGELSTNIKPYIMDLKKPGIN